MTNERQNKNLRIYEALAYESAVDASAGGEGLTPDERAEARRFVDGMRARVFGALTSGVAASMPIGAFAAGVAVDLFGVTPVLAGAAALYVVLAASPLFLRSFDGLSGARHATSAAVADTAVDGREAEMEGQVEVVDPVRG